MVHSRGGLPANCRTTVAAVLLVGFGLTMTSGQYSYFGKSKVQTREYPFQSYETEHFRILFYPGGETILEFAAKAAEDYYGAFARDLGFELEGKTPLILYLSPGQFSETNVVTDVIEEGVGGFAELFKNRIVVPFNGSYNDLYHVVGHELTHIFEFQMYYRSRLSSLLGAVGEFQIPLWVMEGFAEFQSGWVNVSSEVFMRDLLLSNRFVPLQDLHDGMGYFIYREGESFFQYIAGKYGRKKVYEFMHALKNRRNVEATFPAVFGMSVERVSEEWEGWLRQRYWPSVTKVQNIKNSARLLTNHREDGSVYNTAPAISPSGTKVAMVSDRLEYVDCYVVSTLDGKVLKRLVRGGRSGGFETMHLIRPGLTWSPDENVVALVTTSAGRDNIALVDYPGGRARSRIAPDLDAIYSPRFSPDGRKIAFVGLKNGFSDIYLVDSKGGEPQRITYDMYEERDPSFSTGGDTIAFVSDRPDPDGEWVPGSYAVWVLAPARSSFTAGQSPDAGIRIADSDTRPARVFKRLSARHSSVASPVFANTGPYLLYAAADSAENIYVYSLSQEKVVRKTDFPGEVSYLTISSDDRKLAFSYFHDVGWDVAVMIDPFEKIPSVGDSELSSHTAVDTVAFSRKGIDHERVKPVGFSLTPDYAIGAASYSGYGGLAGEVNVAFSDMLGNHRFELYTDLYRDLLNSDLTLEYWLLPSRVDYGFAFFQYRDLYYDTNLERDVYLNRGGAMIGIYPFNKFARVELGLTGYAADVHYQTYDTVESYWQDTGRAVEAIFYPTGALVFDNTYWTWQGPARGTRTRLGCDVAVLSRRQFQDFFVDLRNYQRIGRRFVFASRVFGLTSFGRDAREYFIGGEVVRGYGLNEFYAASGSSVGLAGLELRFPFVDRLEIAFPLPLRIGGIRGVGFLDAGLVFREGMAVWDSEANRLDDLKLGVGAGIRIQISYFSLMFDWAKPLSSTSDKGWKFVFGLGTDF